MFRYSFLLSGFLFLNACSTVIDGPTQDMRIETPGADNSVCYVENDHARYKVIPPKTVKITKFKNPFDVRCLASGNRKKIVHIEPEYSNHVYFNVANGVVPGTFADYSTKSMFLNPELVVVDFTGVKPVSYPRPDYHRDIVKNPEILQYEEFRTGKPALQSDRYEEPYELQKTDRAISLIGNVDSGDSSEGSESGAGSEGGASSDNGVSADSLTRSMNPDVFYGGSGAGASNAPTDLR